MDVGFISFFAKFRDFQANNYEVFIHTYGVIAHRVCPTTRFSNCLILRGNFGTVYRNVGRFFDLWILTNEYGRV